MSGCEMWLWEPALEAPIQEGIMSKKLNIDNPFFQSMSWLGDIILIKCNIRGLLFSGHHRRHLLHVPVPDPLSDAQKGERLRDPGFLGSI